jgi:hypothetical protein
MPLADGKCKVFGVAEELIDKLSANVTQARYVDASPATFEPRPDRNPLGLSIECLLADENVQELRAKVFWNAAKGRMTAG